MPWSALVGALRKYAMFTLDRDGVIDSWNEGVQELLGYEEPDFVGHNGEIIFTPEDRAKHAAERELAQARETGEAVDDRWHLRKDGSRVWVNGVMHAVRDEGGTVVGFVKIMRDQTERRVAGERLEESEERFAKAFRSNPTPIAILEQPEPRIVDVNQAFTQAFRLERPDAIGRTPREVGVEPDEDEFERVRTEMAQGRAIRTETPFRRSDGERGYATFAFEPIDLGGEPHAVMLMHDVTEWRRTHDQLEQQRRFVTAILDSLPGVFYMLDEHRLVRWNEEMERVTGRTPDELAAASAGDVVVEGEAVREHVDAAFRTGEASMEGHLRTKDGTLVPYLLTGRRIVLDDVPFVLGVGVEIREHVRARRALERRAREQTAFADLAASALSADDLLPTLDLAARRVSDSLGAEHVEIAEVEEGRAVVRVSRHQEDASAATPPIVEGRRFDEGPGSLLDDSAGPWPHDVLAPLGLKSGIRARIRGRKRSFGFIEALSEREAAFSEDDVRFLRAVAFLLAGAIEQHRLHQELAHRAEHDDLTGLLTRVTFERRLADALARAERTGTKVAALFLDLDRFKNINDSLGHQVGDEVLRHVAQRLRDTVRSWDVVARHGGDEFVLFLPDIASNAEAAHVTERLFEALEEPITIAGRELTIGTTIGVATFPEDGENASMLLRAADTALYEGKGRGRNTFHFFTREQNERVTERLELESNLRRALDENEFHVLYQPQVDLDDGSVHVVEALLRWRHPERGNIGPSAFLTVAEEIGLAVPLGEWALRQAFADHAGWRGLPGAPERIAVNVSPLHFVQPSFPGALAALARETGIEPHEIEVEISEDTLLKDPALVEEHLRTLHVLGIRIVVDDFGAHASPLARLRYLPIDRLKIDETFTHQVEDPGGRRLLAAIVQVALEFGIEPVAEGIETPEQHAVVRALGFRAAQGRHFSGPRAHGDLLAFLKATIS